MLTHLTAPRLATVQSFFNTNSTEELLGCYAWCQAVGASLLPILGDFEVTLRNAIHRGLSQHYSGTDSFDWMLKTRPNPAKQKNPGAPDLAWHKLSANTVKEIEKTVSKIKHKNRAPSVDDIVSKFSFGFWETIVGGLSHSSHPLGMQHAVLSVAFPHAPDLNTVTHGDAAFVRRLQDLLYQVRDVRNRIGHHDQIWKTPEFDAHGKLGFIPRRPRHSVTSLRMLADRIAWVAGWIDPQIYTHIKNSDHWWSLQALLTQKALAVYRKNGGRVGTYEAVIRSGIPHGFEAWPKSNSKLPDRAHQLSKRMTINQFFY